MSFIILMPFIDTNSKGVYIRLYPLVVCSHKTVSVFVPASFYSFVSCIRDRFLTPSLCYNRCCTNWTLSKLSKGFLRNNRLGGAVNTKTKKKLNSLKGSKLLPWSMSSIRLISGFLKGLCLARDHNKWQMQWFAEQWHGEANNKEPGLGEIEAPTWDQGVRSGPRGRDLADKKGCAQGFIPLVGSGVAQFDQNRSKQ